MTYMNFSAEENQDTPLVQSTIYIIQIIKSFFIVEMGLLPAISCFTARMLTFIIAFF